jgi:hypothetical protein
MALQLSPAANVGLLLEDVPISTGMRGFTPANDRILVGFLDEMKIEGLERELGIRSNLQVPIAANLLFKRTRSMFTSGFIRERGLTGALLTDVERAFRT